MLKLELGGLNPGDAKSASRTGLNSSFQRAIFDGLVTSRTVQAREESSPEGLASWLSVPRGLNTLIERLQLQVLDKGGLGLGLGLGIGGDGGDGRHDRLPLSAQSKGDFRPRLP